jgi:hypothetical protein
MKCMHINPLLEQAILVIAVKQLAIVDSTLKLQVNNQMIDHAAASKCQQGANNASPIMST